MDNECVVAVYSNVEQARLAAHILARTDLPTGQISLIASGLEDYPEIEAKLQIGEDDQHEVMLGAGLGSLVGVLAGASLLVVGGTVALVIGAFAGLLTGAMTGTYLGAMSGWGVHASRIKHYEALVNAGHPLLITHGNPLEVAKAYRLLQQTATMELHVYASSDDNEPPSVG